MEKTKDAVKRELKKQYECACNGYVAELLRKWELDAYYGYWIGEEVGGIYDYGGSFTITMEDIIYCVENEVTEEEYSEWLEYCTDASEFNMVTPNLKSWRMGCPRTDNETFERLRGLKADLAKAIEEEKERIRTNTMEQQRIKTD